MCVLEIVGAVLECLKCPRLLFRGVVFADDADLWTEGLRCWVGFPITSGAGDDFAVFESDIGIAFGDDSGATCALKVGSEHYDFLLLAWARAFFLRISRCSVSLTNHFTCRPLLLSTWIER